MLVIKLNNLILRWGHLPQSVTVTSGNAGSSAQLPITFTTLEVCVGNGGNNGGSSWSNINFNVENHTTVYCGGWIQGTGYIGGLHYIAIGF